MAATGSTETGMIDSNTHLAMSVDKDDLLSCQWSNCTEKCPTPESLYDHICERHVGRKSTNNLNLTCAWGNCRTTTVKRDHITSHIRVHVPLKPHKCDFCGKSFKRPQDLKKHVKTHADDSVLLRSPDPSKPEPFSRTDSSRVVAPGYYDTSLPTSGTYSHQTQVPSNANSFYATQQQAPYGSVYYASPQGDIGQQATVEKQRGINAVNEFLGQLKRRELDPNSYAEIGNRLLQFQSFQTTFAGIPECQPAPILSSNGGSQPLSMPQPQYSLPPMPNLRTKHDLMDIDHILEQMQTTVYESPAQAAAAGIAQPGSHYTHSDLSFRQSHSPPQLHPVSTASAAPLSASTPSSSTSGGTPALTPPSSTMSYTSSQSPRSLPPVHVMSPDPHTMTNMYPSLPAISGAADNSSGYATSSSAAPASVLGSAFDTDIRRRYSGGRLQQAVKANQIDGSEDVATPRAGSPYYKSGSAKNLEPQISHMSINEDLADDCASPPSSDTSEDRAQEEWVNSARIIEGLRTLIADKLERHDYEDDEDTDVHHEDETAVPNRRKDSLEDESQTQSLYPKLNIVGA